MPVPSNERLAALLDAHAPWGPLPVVPRVSAWQAPDELALWQALEREAGAKLDPPFFCVAWPGAQVLAKGLEAKIVDVAGKRVLDVGCGSGVAGCMAGLMGAQAVAADVDPLAVRSAVILGRRHGLDVTPLVADVLAQPDVDADVILCADLIYSATQREHFARALSMWRGQGRTVLVADSGRPFFDATGLVERMAVEVDVPTGVEGQARRTARLYTLAD